MAIANPVEKMMNATYRCAKEHGLENLNFKDIGPAAGMTYQNMYNYFTGKDELLQASFIAYDKKIADLFEDIDISIYNLPNDIFVIIKDMWYKYFNFLVSHPDETIFYMQFRFSPDFPAYQASRDESHFAHFLSLIKNIDKLDMLNNINMDLLWGFIINGTIINAKYVIDGRYDNDEKTRTQMFALISGGIKNILNI